MVQPIGRASFFPKEKKSDDPPAANLESRLYKYKGANYPDATMRNCFDMTETWFSVQLSWKYKHT